MICDTELCLGSGFDDGLLRGRYAGAGDDDGAREPSVISIPLLFLDIGAASCELGGLNLVELSRRGVDRLNLGDLEASAGSVEPPLRDGEEALLNEMGLCAVVWGVLRRGECCSILLLLIVEFELPRISATSSSKSREFRSVSSLTLFDG